MLTLVYSIVTFALLHEEALKLSEPADVCFVRATAVSQGRKQPTIRMYMLISKHYSGLQ